MYFDSKCSVALLVSVMGWSVQCVIVVFIFPVRTLTIVFIVLNSTDHDSSTRYKNKLLKIKTFFKPKRSLHPANKC